VFGVAHHFVPRSMEGNVPARHQDDMFTRIVCARITCVKELVNSLRTCQEVEEQDSVAIYSNMLDTFSPCRSRLFTHFRLAKWHSRTDSSTRTRPEGCSKMYLSSLVLSVARRETRE
jgi:hypothetical protein